MRTMLKQPMRCRSEGRAQSDFALAYDRPAQHQVGNVRAGHQQHQSDRAEQEEQRLPHLPRQLVEQRDGHDDQRERRVAELRRIVGANARGQRARYRLDACSAVCPSLSRPRTLWL